VGRGVPHIKRESDPAKLLPASGRYFYFAAEIHRRVGTVVAQANSRFLHSAVAGAPAPVGMTGCGEGNWPSRAQ
jgi:hypothetical protein